MACADGALPDPTSHRCAHQAAPPNLTACTPDADFGTPEFSAWWHDPEFDPNQAAFYYARVLQVPTCRWSTYDAHRLGVEPTPFVPPSIQERAITSAIWYTPK